MDFVFHGLFCFVDFRDLDAGRPGDVGLRLPIVSVHGVVMYGVSGPLVELPVADEVRVILCGIVRETVHVFPYLLLCACYPPYTRLGDLSLQRAVVVVGPSDAEAVCLRHSEGLHCERDAVVGAGAGHTDIPGLVRELPVHIDAGGAGRLVIGAGYMVPQPRLELLGRVGLGRELPELGAVSAAVELELLPLEAGVADSKEEVLLHSHYGGYVALAEVI